MIFLKILYLCVRNINVPVLRGVELEGNFLTDDMKAKDSVWCFLGLKC